MHSPTPHGSWHWLFTENRLQKQNTTPFIGSIVDSLRSPCIGVANFPTTIEDIRALPTAENRLLKQVTPPLFSKRFADFGAVTIGDLLVNHQWLPLDSFPAFHSLPPIIRQELAIKYNRVKAFLRLHHATALTVTEDGPPAHLTFCSNNGSRLSLNKTTRRTLQDKLTHTFFNMAENQSLSDFWSKDKISWHSLFCKLVRGRDCEIAWRLAKNRLADTIFLHKARLKEDSFCPFCPNIEGTAWHMIMDCIVTRDLWACVSALVKKIINKNHISLMDLYKGFAGKSHETNLANFLVTSAKAIIYDKLTEFLKDGRAFNRLRDVYVKTIRYRLATAFAWHQGSASTEIFESHWCCNKTLCYVEDECLVFSDGLT